MHAEQQIAIVGTACRFPGGSDPNGFWKLLTEGREAIVPVPSDRWDPESRLDPERKIPTVGGFLDEIDEFDATFFGISPREAENIDPQQRIMLEMSWRALEDAGITATSLARTRTGVYLGAEWHDYELVGRDLGSAITPHTGPGNALDMLSSRISYFLELTGPSVVTETGCSSSLVAVHNACRALVTGEVDTAITGGVNLLLHPHGSVTLAHFGGLSVEGRCKAFGAGADGFVRAEGAAALFLKRLDRALEDGDRVQAIIQHTHVNNDGGGQSVVAPNPEGQEDLLRSVYPHGGIDADDLAYVEAHGTGTALGDPVEAGALGRVLGRRRSPERGPLPIGSVKTNVGHLEAASGMPALFKALLSLRHRVVPSSLHADTLNPEIPFEELNIDVVREPLTLPPTGDLFIGVNSFGWGGTNAHVLLRSAPPSPTETERTPVSAPYFLPLSAHSQDALTQRAEQIRTTLEETALEGVTGTLTHARDHFPVRAAIVVDDDLAGKEELERYLHSPEAPPPGVPAGRSLPVGRVAFVFPGQGSQWEHMGCELWEASPVFADTIHRCAEALAPYVDWDLKAVLAGHAGPEWMERIDMLQPTLWAVSLGLFEMWRHAGIVPDVVVGHSQGEITAATAAGILDLEEGAKIVARRSAIARRTSGKGRMLAVDLGIEEARAALVGFEESVSVAVNNGPRSCVLSGETDMVLALKDILEVDGVYCRLVNVDYASHSPQMDPLEKDLLEALAGIEPTRGTIPLASTVRPEGVEGTQMDARYWVDNLRRPVLFADTLGDLLDEEVTHVVEVSPHPVLVPAVEQLAAERGEPTRVLSTLRRNEGSPRCFQTSLAQAYVAGLEPFATLPPHTWSPVPGYPWQRESHWVRAGRRRVDPRSVTAPKLTPSLSEPDTWEARSDVALGDIPWARDHRVHDITVLCGTGMMDLALRTARARTGTGHGVLVDVQFRETLPLGETPLALAQRWREDDHGGGTFTLLSLPEGANRWRDHMSARVLLDPAPPQDVPFPEHLSSLPTTGTEEFYATCLSRGLDYGPAFRSVRTLHLGQEEALAELVLPKDCPPVEGPHLVHPALWDGALQACIPLFPAEGPVLPISIDRVDTHSAPDSPLTTVHSHAVRVGDRAQLRLYDDRYRLVMTVHGLTMRVLEEPEHAASDIADGTHVFAFTPAPRPPRGNTATTWAVCHSGNAGKRAEALVEALQAAGSSGIVLEARAEHAGKTREWAQLLTSVPDPDGLVLLTADADSGLPAQRKGLNEAAALVRACTDLPSPPRLALATVGAQSPAPSSGPCDPGAALYWGFGRVLGSEHPELRTTLIDVDDDPSWAHMCAEELLTAEPHDQVALRGEDRYIGSVVSGDVEHATAPQHPTQPATGQGFRVLTARPGLWEGVEHRPSERWALAPEEVEVKMAAVSLNFIDVMRTMGIYPDPSGDPRSLGLDGAGTVTRVGAKVSGIVPGERVALYSNGGSLASHRTVPSFAVQPLPSGWSESEAATLPAVAITAWAALHDLAHVREGETVLIHSATGGLGLAAIQIARLLGGKVIATAGNPRKRRHLFDLGVEHVFDSRDLSWADRVLEVTQGRGVDVVLNSLTGAAIPLGLKVLADGGHFVEVGKKDIYSGRPLGLNTFKKGLTVSSFDLARVRERRPEYFARLFSEVWQQVEDGRLLPLPSIERPFSAAAEALREMSHGEHIGKFVITTPESVDSLTPEPLREGRFRGDGTYLISGGLGALGLSLAEFMVERGAGGVALLGRSDPGPEANERLATLREVGAKVTVLRADVSDADALRRARSQLPPLRGVVHAAGLLDDATVSTLSAEQLERVLAPKVDGAVNLDAATTDDPLDFFVLFSSAAGLLGNAGQAAYAAANTFLDAFATRRRQEGRPALSLQWGPFEDVGLAAAEDLRGRRLDARGMLSFPVARAWQVLEDLLQRDAPVVSYAPIDHRLYLESHPEKAHVASFRGWHENASGSGGASSPLSERLHRAEAVDRPALLESEIRSLAGRVLGLAEEAVEPDTPFKALGLDSLMGLELRNRLEAATGVRLSPTLLWTYGTARALAEALAEQLSETADQGQE